MGLVQNFLKSFREDDTMEPGLIQKDDGTVWLVNPDGSETQLPGGSGGGLGIWKTYVDNASNVPLSGVAVGDGLLVGKWWTPAAVVADLATDPFLVVLTAQMSFGSTSSVDDVLGLDLPLAVDGSPYGLAPASSDSGAMWTPGGISARVGGIQYPGFVFDVGAGGIIGPDSTAWDTTHPAAWASGDKIGISLVFQAVFENPPS